MKIYIAPSDGKAVIIEHKKLEPLDFECLKALKVGKKGKDGSDEFSFLNLYWASLSEQEQDGLYELYRKVHLSVENFDTVSDGIALLRPLVCEIADKYHDLDDIAVFLESQKIDYGPNIQAMSLETNPDMPPETTYNRNEYFGLCCLALAFKALFPIWHLWVKYYPSGEYGENRQYQILDLFSLITGSNLAQSPEFTKLLTYCEHIFLKEAAPSTNNKKQEVSNYPAIEGCGSSDFPLYLMGKVLMEKLSRAHINDPDENVTLISATHRKLTSDLKSLYGNQRRLRSRSIDSGRSDGYDDEKVGWFEALNTHEAVPASVPAIHQVNAWDYRKLKNQLDKDIPASLVKMCIDSFDEFEDARIGERFVLAAWVLSNSLHDSSSDALFALKRDEERNSVRIMHHQAISGIDQLAMKHVIAVTQAALIHWHMHTLAALLSSVPVEPETIGYSTEIANFNATIKNKMVEMNPYFRPNPRSNSTRPSSLCAAFVDIETLIVKYYIDTQLNLRCSKELAAALRATPGVYDVPATLRNDLAELLLFLNKNM